MIHRCLGGQQMRAFIIVLLSLPMLIQAGEKDPVIDRQTIKGQWEAISTDDLRYFYLDLSTPDRGALVMGFWYDTVLVSSFKMTSYQISRGSVMLLFEGMERSSTDRIVISGKGRASDSTGTLDADFQMALHQSVISRKRSLVFRKVVKNEPSTLSLLKTVASECIRKMERIQKK
ncbi:MAG: hypothetical protein JXA71_16455 [Chitinispirillaceae bacterium]|nr:hypothetical protein [Chitinispirillaceae bacterium]